MSGAWLVLFLLGAEQRGSLFSNFFDYTLAAFYIESVSNFPGIVVRSDQKTLQDAFMGIQLMIIASLFVAASNFCMRRSIDSGGSSKAFLMIQLSIVFLVAVLLNPVRTGDYQVSNCMLFFGLAGGIILAIMMNLPRQIFRNRPPRIDIRRA